MYIQILSAKNKYAHAGNNMMNAVICSAFFISYDYIRLQLKRTKTLRKYQAIQQWEA
jgi:hypothetical protein